MERRQPRGSRAGLTLMEMMIALTILSLVMANVTMATRAGSKAYQAGTFANHMEEQVDQTMDRISFALMASSPDLIDPVPVAPNYSSSIDYEVSLGYEDGDLVLADPERIEFQAATGQIRWVQNPLMAHERSLVWSNWVAEQLEGEELNGKDDNANGLSDESGLAFNMDGNKITIHLTIRRTNADGLVQEQTKRAQVTCRN